MKKILGFLFVLLQVACILVLLYVVSGIGALILTSALDVCPQLNEGNIRCNSETYQSIAEYGMTVLLITVFTGLPALMAIAGLVFIVRALLKLRSRRASPAAPHQRVRTPSSGAAAPSPSAGRGLNRYAKIALYILGAFIVAGTLAGAIQRIAGY